MTAIEAVNLTKIFSHQSGWTSLFARSPARQTVAVDRLSLQIEGGTIFGVLGPNGAGKTTFIKMICSLLLPTSGEARVFGHDVVRESALVRKEVGLVTSDERSFYWRLTGRQNMEFFASVYGLNMPLTRRRIEEVVEMLDLKEYIDRRFNEYSTGIKQKMAIARGLLSAPRLLVMDEPTKGLDPLARHSFLLLMRNRIISTMKCTIIFCTNIPSEAEQVCDRIAIINHGRIIYSGTPEETDSATGRHSTYRIVVRGIEGPELSRLEGIPGVEACTCQLLKHGEYELALRLDASRPALSDALKFLGRDGCEIVKCARETADFDEMVRDLMHASREGPVRG